jgi:hypothetical protein
MADKIVKGRNFATVVYVDSAPVNWQDLLAENFIPAFISPYHDKDLDPTGDPKKPHYHVMIMFDGPVVQDQARSIFSLIGGVGCEMIKSLRGYARYLCHLDNPDKVQYSVDDVRSFCGADYHGVIGLAVDKYVAIQEMIDFCESRDIFSFYHLVLYARSERFDWFRILCDSGAVMMRNYIKSRKWTFDSGILFSESPGNPEN